MHYDFSEFEVFIVDIGLYFTCIVHNTIPGNPKWQIPYYDLLLLLLLLTLWKILGFITALDSLFL